MLVTGPASPFSDSVQCCFHGDQQLKLYKIDSQHHLHMYMVMEELDRSTTGLDVRVYVRWVGVAACRGGCVSACGRDWQECKPVCACGCHSQCVCVCYSPQAIASDSH